MMVYRFTLVILVLFTVSNSFGQNGSISIGANNQIGAFDSSFVVGSSNSIDASYSVVLGRNLQSTATSGFVIGTGIDNTNKLTNSRANTLFVGFNSNYPTLTVTGGDGTDFSFGRIGIGDDNPEFLIDARSQGNDFDAILQIANGDASQLMQFFPGRSGDPEPYIGVAENSPLRFSMLGGTKGFNEIMRILPDTLVGIGTQTPQASLEIYETSPRLRLRSSEDTGGATAEIQFGKTNGALFEEIGNLGIPGSGDFLRIVSDNLFQININSGVRAWFTATGMSVGPTVSNPLYPLDVNGTIRSGREGTSGELILYSEQGATDYEYSIIPNSAATQNVTLTLPVNDGDPGQLLSTDGSGNLAWASTGGFTASNGLSNVSSDIQIGGEIANPTDINLITSDFTITSNGNPYITFDGTSGIGHFGIGEGTLTDYELGGIAERLLYLSSRSLDPVNSLTSVVFNSTYNDANQLMAQMRFIGNRGGGEAEISRIENRSGSSPESGELIFYTSGGPGALNETLVLTEGNEVNIPSLGTGIVRSSGGTLFNGNISANEITSGVLPVARGGTGSNAFTSGSVIFSNGTSLTQDNAGLYFDASTNRLGIGTNTPNQALDIVGYTRIGSGPNGADQALLLYSPAPGFAIIESGARSSSEFRISQSNNAPLSFYTNGAQRVQIDGSGNMGIGVSPPAYRLHVAGDGYFTNNIGLGTAPNSTRRVFATGTSYGIWAEGSTMGGRFIDTNGSGEVWVGYADYGIYQNGGAENYFSGEVGIGITSPTQRLHVVGNAFMTGDQFIGSQLAVGQGTTVPTGIATFNAGSTLGEEGVEITSSDTWGTALNIDSSTGNSTWSLITAGSSHPDLPAGSFAIEGNGNYGMVIDGLLLTTYLAPGTATKLALGFNPGDATSYKLELPNSTTTGYGRARANLWATYSDDRVKLDQFDLNYGMKEIMALKPKRYNHYSSAFEEDKLVLGKNYEQQVGFVAQEVYEVIPEIVYKPEDESGDLWSMDYEKLTAVIVAALQEIDPKINKNSQEVQELLLLYQSLANRLSEQEAEIERLKAQAVRDDEDYEELKAEIELIKEIINAQTGSTNKK